jgi:pyruvate,orthophosphate dikinase
MTSTPAPQAHRPLYFLSPREVVPEEASPATVGAKAYGLLRLAQLGLTVPPGFVLGTEVCRRYFAGGRKMPPEVRDLVLAGLARLEEATGRRFGDDRHPLLVSVRSGAPVSMPGMLETILNIGLCERTLHGLLRVTGNPHLTLDSYRRLARDFAEAVHGAPPGRFDALLERECAREGLSSARDLDTAALRRIAEESLEIAAACTGRPFPQDPHEQLDQAIEVVLRSWQSEKARQYRAINHIDEEPGTAVIIQAMVFGNAGSQSGAGVGFTRDPATGQRGLYLDFLFNAQGEDVVAGRHAVGHGALLEQRLPEIGAQLRQLGERLEKEFRDVQDFEFTVESGKLFLLQTRTAQRTPWAALRIAVDLVHEGLIRPAEALSRLSATRLEGIERTRLDTGIESTPIASAAAAGIGVATGSIAFDARQAAHRARAGQHVILVRHDIHAADIEGIAAADGILTASGGKTSHAAVVARQLNKVCLVNCATLRIDPDGSGCTIGGIRLAQGEELTLDGNSGNVYRGRIAVIRERPEAELAEAETWRRAMTSAG